MIQLLAYRRLQFSIQNSVWRISRQLCLFLRPLALIQLLQTQVNVLLLHEVGRHFLLFIIIVWMLTTDATYPAIFRSSLRFIYCLHTFSVHQVINRSLGSIFPRNVQKAVLEGLFSLGQAQVSDYILNEKNPLGSLRLARLRSILNEGKSLQLQFPAEDLGFR